MFCAIQGSRDNILGAEETSVTVAAYLLLAEQVAQTSGIRLQRLFT